MVKIRVNSKAKIKLFGITVELSPGGLYDITSFAQDERIADKLETSDFCQREGGKWLIESDSVPRFRHIYSSVHGKKKTSKKKEGQNGLTSAALNLVLQNDLEKDADGFYDVTLMINGNIPEKVKKYLTEKNGRYLVSRDKIEDFAKNCRSIQYKQFNVTSKLADEIPRPSAPDGLERKILVQNILELMALKRDPFVINCAIDKVVGVDGNYKAEMKRTFINARNAYNGSVPRRDADINDSDKEKIEWVIQQMKNKRYPITKGLIEAARILQETDSKFPYEQKKE